MQVFDHEVDRYGKDVQKAMVWNVSVNVEELRLKASRTPISWIFHKVFKNAFIISCILKKQFYFFKINLLLDFTLEKDDGTERSRTGERLIRIGAADVRARKRKFKEEINHGVFNATLSLYVKWVRQKYKHWNINIMNK